MGLDEKSQKVYLALLRLGDAPATIIAKKAEVERTTAHHHLEHLIRLGLASSYRERHIKRFVAESPTKLKGVLESKMALVNKYLPLLQGITRSERKTSLRLFEGEEGMRQIIEEELGCREKVVRSIGSVKDLRRAQGGKITFTERRLKCKVFSKCLRPKNDKFDEGWLEKQTEELREVRLLPEEMTLSGMIFIFDNKVTVITPEEEGVGFIIESESMSSSMKTIFDALWHASQKTSCWQ